MQSRTMREGGHARGSFRSLQFVPEPANASSWISAVGELLQRGHRTISARLLDDAASKIAPVLAAEFGAAFAVSEPSGEPTRSASPRSEVTLLIGGDADKISAALLDYLDVATITLVAPVTARHCKSLPLYLISIPKAGTHLLFRLTEALGYAAGGVAPEQPRGGYWYYLLHSNAHTTAREFFRDELQRAPFGNRAHPFMRSPALFNYRDPRDILVSEANYWHIDGNSPLSVLLGHLSFEQRVARLLDDRWVLGSIRDRVGEFAAWLDCANVIPVSFEEMVGDAGGGSDAAFDALVWSLQLKLHVPGISKDICSAASDRSSPTFREGRVNGWRQSLPAKAIGKIEALPQDFMEMFGYDGSSVLPRHAEAFRIRPLKLMSAMASVPYLVESDFLGHNVVAYNQQYYGVPLSAGAVDFSRLSTDELSKFVTGENVSSVHARIVMKEVERQISPAIGNLIRSELEQLRNGRGGSIVNTENAPTLEPNVPDQICGRDAARVLSAPSGDERVGPVHSLGSFLKYNLFERRDCVIAVPMRLGPVDPNVYELRFKRGVIASSGLIATRIRILCARIRGDY